MPPPTKPAADIPKKIKNGLSNGKVHHDEDIPSESTVPTEEVSTEPEPNEKLTQADEFLSDLEDIIKSGAMTNGSALDHETEEEEEKLQSAASLDEEDTHVAEELPSASPVGEEDTPVPQDQAHASSQSHNGTEPTGGQDTEVGGNSANANREDQPPSGDHENLGDADQASQMGGPSEAPGGLAGEPGPSEPTEGGEEAPTAPVGGIEGDTTKQNSDKEDASDEPQESEAKEEKQEPDPLIDVNPLIIDFVAECCRTADDNAATARELYIAYLRWCDEYDKQPLRQRDFGINLSGMGFTRQRRARGRHWWIGIGMATKKEAWEIDDE